MKGLACAFLSRGNALHAGAFGELVRRGAPAYMLLLLHKAPRERAATLSHVGVGTGQCLGAAMLSVQGEHEQ